MVSSVWELILTWLPWVAWAAWWLFVVDWRGLGEVLGRGAWAPGLLLGVAVVGIWALLNPGPQVVFGVALPNVTGKAAFVGLLYVVAGLSGLVQTTFLRPASQG